MQKSIKKASFKQSVSTVAVSAPRSTTNASGRLVSVYLTFTTMVLQYTILGGNKPIAGPRLRATVPLLFLRHLSSVGDKCPAATIAERSMPGGKRTLGDIFCLAGEASGGVCEEGAVARWIGSRYRRVGLKPPRQYDLTTVALVLSD